MYPGYRVDRYELLCALAQGSSAAVWLARSQGKFGFERLFAVKLFDVETADGARVRQTFIDESRIASRVEHPNIAQIFDMGEQRGLLYLVLEWVDGDPVRALLRALERRDQRLPLGIALRIVVSMCAGLHAAHELRSPSGEPLELVHRDVCPQNVLVTPKGIVKVIDFGIAKTRDRASQATELGEMKGRIEYMAPEQALGGPVDRRADVWSLAAVCHHLLSGAPPFEASNPIAMLRLLSSGATPRALPGELGPIADVIVRGLRREPADRHANAAEFAQALEDTAQSSGVPIASLAALGAFVAEHLQERIAKRAAIVKQALLAAEERSRVQSVLTLPSEDSDSGAAAPSLGQAVRAPVPASLATAPISKGEVQAFSSSASSAGRAAVALGTSDDAAKSLGNASSEADEPTPAGFFDKEPSYGSDVTDMAVTPFGPTELARILSRRTRARVVTSVAVVVCGAIVAALVARSLLRWNSADVVLAPTAPIAPTPGPGKAEQASTQAAVKPSASVPESPVTNASASGEIRSFHSESATLSPRSNPPPRANAKSSRRDYGF